MGVEPSSLSRRMTPVRCASSGCWSTKLIVRNWSTTRNVLQESRAGRYRQK